MDSSLLTLFTLEEILKRLGEKESSGGLHVFTTKESANLFLEAGRIVGAVKGLMEGEEVLKQALDWKDPRFVWLANQTATVGLKEINLSVPELFEKLKTAPKLAVGGKPLSTPLRPAAAPSAPLPSTGPSLAAPSSRFINMPARAASTGPMQMTSKEESPARPASAPLVIPPASEPLLTATKAINPTPQARTSQEDILLEKFPLVLVSSGEELTLRLKMVRLSSLVGRNPACEFPINHSSVSRQHCLLQITERGLQVKDLDSTNGTKVNGIVLREEGYINVGDKLTIGHVDFILQKETAAPIAQAA